MRKTCSLVDRSIQNLKNAYFSPLHIRFPETNDESVYLIGIAVRSVIS